MKIFLSYSSEDKEIAETIALSIKGRGHEVFHDRSAGNLPSGETFEDRIENAIEESDLMVFLITPESLDFGRFTLTELKFAQSKWEHPTGKVLPVMIRSTPMDQVPPYLRAVTILEPSGSVPAETAATVDQMAKNSWPRIIRPAYLATFSIVLVLVAITIYYQNQFSTNFVVNAKPPMAFERGFLGSPNIFNIVTTAVNKGNISGKITSATLQFEPKGALSVVGGGPGTNEPINQIVLPDNSFTTHFKIVEHSQDIPTRWRVCATFDKGEQDCSEYQKWKAPEDFLYGDTFSIPNDLSKNATAIAWDGSAYLLTTTQPNAVTRIDEDGSIISTSSLDGIPTAVSYGPHGIFVSTRAPNSIMKLDPKSLQTMKQIEVKWPKDRLGPFDEPVSRSPINIAQENKGVWIITSGGAAGNGLAVFDPELTKMDVPEFYEDISSDLAGMRLKNGVDSVWSGQNDTVPSSIKRINTSALKTYSGHDFEIASCASDVLFRADYLLVPDCNGHIHEVKFEEASLDLVRRIDHLNGYDTNSEAWNNVQLQFASGKKVLGAVTVQVDRMAGDDSEKELSISSIGWTVGASTRLRLTNAALLDFAAGENSIAAIIRSPTGKIQVVTPRIK